MTSKTNGTGCECRALYVVNVDGTGLRRITPIGLRPGGRLDWSPDGKVILFRRPWRDPSGIGSNLYTIQPDGTGLRQLTRFPADARVTEGSYAPDGKSIVFQTSAAAVGVGLPDLFVMNPDGSDVRQLTHTRNFEADADWGPGGGATP